MPTVYSAWTPNSTQTNRMRLRLTYTVPAATAGATSVTVTGSVYIEVRYSINDQNNTYSWSGFAGSGSASKSVVVPTDGSLKLQDFSKAVTLGSSTSSVSFTASLTGIEYVGISNKATVSATIAIPAKVVSSPPGATPSVAVARVSDSSHNVTWGTASGTVSGYHIERWQAYTNKWTRVASVGASVRAWNNSSNHHNDVLQFRVQAYNAAGVGGFGTSAKIWTQPAAPTNVKVTRSGGSLVTSWTINARDAAGQTVQVRSSANGSTWGGWSNAATGLAPSVTSATLTGMDAGLLWQARVVAYVTTPSLTNPSLPSATVQLLAAPKAPTILAPTGTLTTTNAVTARLRHNAVDSTTQTAVEWQYRPAGGSWTTLTGTTSDTVSLGTLAAGTYELQARTRGEHADWSPWSSLATWRMAAPPVIAITDPLDGGSVSASTLTVEVSYSDASGASMTRYTRRLWEAGLLVEDQTIYRSVASGATFPVAFSRTLTNSTSYRAEIVVQSGTGLNSAPVDVVIATDFLPPTQPVITGQWLEADGVVQLVVTIRPGDADGYTGAVPGLVYPGAETYPGTEQAPTDDTDHARVERLDGDRWVVVADQLPPDAGVTDAMVALNVDAVYRVVAVSALGVEAASETITVRTETLRLWLQGEDGTSISLMLNLVLNADEGSELVIEQYLGDRVPTAHFGRPRPRSVAVAGDVVDNYGLRDPFADRLLGQHVWYRDPEGRAFWSAIERVSTGNTSNRHASIGFTATEVVGPRG